MTARKNNLELKYFCKDFEPLRQVLTNLGAHKERIVKQKDYFFNVPVQSKGRMKLRFEDDKPDTLIYYERPDFTIESETESKILLYNVNDSNLLDFLTKSHGVLGIVEKTREVWRLDETVFHIDIISNVGNIFEIELQSTNTITQENIDMFNNYKSQVLPFLNDIVVNSNIDLVLQ